MPSDIWYTHIGPTTGAIRAVVRKRRWWPGYKIVIEKECKASWQSCPPPPGRDYNYDRVIWVPEDPWNYLGQFFHLHRSTAPEDQA